MHKLRKKLLQELGYYTGKYSPFGEYVSLIITYGCNFRCKACEIWKKEDKNELDEGSWIKIVNQLKEVLPQKSFIEINGGEPLLNKHLVYKIISCLKSHFSSVTLNTNGSLLDMETIYNLEKSGLDKIKFSLYSMDSKIHDFLRGTKGAYARVIGAIALATQSKLEVEIGTLITSKNIKDIPEIIKWAQDKKNTSVILQPLDEKIESIESKNLSKNHLESDLWPAKKEISILFSWVKNNRKQIKNSDISLRNIEKYYLNPKSALQYRCFAGQRNLVIEPDGSLQFCFKGKKIGNLCDHKLLPILESSTALDERKRIKNCQKLCRIMGCNFSRGYSELASDTINTVLYRGKN